MMATATVSSASPRYAPEDPTLPKPWKGLVDGKTVYLYFWNPESNVTQYEKLAASSHTGSAPPQKLSSAPVSSSVQVEQSSHGHCDSIFNNDDDRYNGGSNSGSKLDTGTRSYQFLTLAFRLKYCPMGCINSICMRSLLNYVKHSLSHPFSHSISEKARNGASLLKFYLIAEKMPELLDFDKDLVHLEAAYKIQLKSLAEEMQAVSKGLEKVEQELTASENDGAISAGFQKGRSADSLSQYFGDPARCPFEQGGSYSSIQFSWQTRTRICIGIARGLAILHEEVRPHIIHRDIKANNILLDKDLTPKISDFGLPKLILANMTHVSTRVAGTIALVADGCCLLVCCRCAAVAAAEFCWATAAAMLL